MGDDALAHGAGPAGVGSACSQQGREQWEESTLGKEHTSACAQNCLNDSSEYWSPVVHAAAGKCWKGTVSAQGAGGAQQE